MAPYRPMHRITMIYALYAPGLYIYIYVQDGIYTYISIYLHTDCIYISILSVK